MPKEMPMKRLALLLAALATAALCPHAFAQDNYPNRTVRIITTNSAGGISDVFGRALGEELHKIWGQAVIIDNRPGGMNNTGTRACSEAQPDGYTLCIVNADPLAYNQFLLKTMPFKPETAVTPVTNLYYLIQMLVVNADLKVKNTDELIALSRAKPGTLSYLAATPPLMLYMEAMKKERGADWVRVPFRGGGEAVNAMMSGTTPIALLGEANVIGHIQAGKMTPLAMVNNIKSPNFPNVPTLAETGYKGAVSESWYGLFVPPGTPKPIIDRVMRDVAKVVSDPAFIQRHLTQRSLVPALSKSSDEFAELIKRDRTVAERVVKAAGLEPQ
jgi:tripartite-type tricarboxylate transporter receptor subunit TctC